MQIKPHRIRTKTAVVLAFCCGLIAACAHERPLVVPTTPPSERNENPGLDRPAGGREKSSALGRGCSSAEDCFNAALQNAEDGDRTNAAAVLKSLRERYPDTPWAKRAGFLLGLWAAEDASPDADALLSKAMKDFPPLEEYGLFFMAGGQAKRGEFRVAVETYDRLLRKFPESALAAQAQYQKGAALFLAGDCPSALTEWNAFLVRFPKDENAAKALLQQADCAVKLQDSARAVRELLQVWFFYADSPEATEARKNLERLGASGVKIPGPTIEARTQRGRTLFDAARYAEAADEFKAVLAAGEPANRDEIESKLSEALIQLKQYDEARQLLTGLAARTGHPDILTNAMFWLGRLAIRQGEEARVLQIERQLADRFPSSPERAKLLFMIGDFYEYRDQTEPAIKTYRRLIAELPADPSAEDAVWRLGWIAYKARRYGDAIKILGEDLQRRSSGPLGGQFGYWIGRSAEAMDQPLKAANAYREVCRGFLRSFYCQQATVQLARLARLNSQAAGDTEADRPADAPPEAALKKVNGTIIGLPTGGADASLMRDRHYAVSLELMALHLKPEAARELDALAERYATDKATVLKLAELLYAAGDYYHSLRLLKLYFLDVMEKGGDDIPKSFWEQAYPNHFLDLVKRQSPAATVDPYLVAAVAREESAFDPKAVSKVGALGLMQLMPYTGEWVARRVGLKPFSPDLLLDGAVNIRLGAWYLQHLVEQFNGNVVLAVASYNAGPEAVGRWAEKGAGNLDEFIESIPFNETRYFTKKVIRSYNEYRRIAGENPDRRLSGVPVSP